MTLTPGAEAQFNTDAENGENGGNGGDGGTTWRPIVTFDGIPVWTGSGGWPDATGATRAARTYLIDRVIAVLAEVKKDGGEVAN